MDDKAYMATSRKTPSPKRSLTAGKCLSPRQAEELGDRLYARAQDKKLHLEHLAKQITKQETNGFTPTIFTSPKHRETGPKLSNTALGNRLSPTFQQVQERRLREEKERVQRETRGCTFKPIMEGLTSTPVPMVTVSSSSRRKTAAAPRLGERMCPSTEALAQQKQRREMIKVQEELKGCTFSPKLYTNGSSPRQAFVQSQQQSSWSSPSSSSSRSSPKPATNFGDRLSPTPDQLKHRQERRQQEKLRAEMAGCTFTPARMASPPCGQGPQPSSSPTAATFNKLYSEAEFRELRLAARQKEKETAELIGCTFRPIISNYNLRGGTEEGGEAGEAATGQATTFARLYQDATVHREMLEAKRREQEEADQRVNTFSPTLPEYALTQPPPLHQESIYERLYQDKVHRQTMEEAHRRQEEANRRVCTFSPTVPEYAALEPHTPSSGQTIHERLYHDQEHQLVLENAQLRQYETERRLYTFSPTLPDYPLPLHTISANTPIHERLYQEASVLHQIRDEAVQQKEEADLRACTFSPALPAYPLLQGQGGGAGNMPIHERLYLEADIHRQIQEEMERRRQELEIRDCTFRPEIPDYSIRPNYQYHHHRQHESLEQHQEAVEKEEEEKEKAKADSLEYAEEEELSALQEEGQEERNGPIGEGGAGIYPIPEDEEEEGGEAETAHQGDEEDEAEGK